VVLGEQRGEPAVGGLRVRREAGDHLQLSVPQAGGDLQAGELGLVAAESGGQLRLERAPHPDGLLPQLRPAGQRPLDRSGRQRGRPHAPELGRWAREDQNGRPVATLRRRDDEARGGADRLQHDGALGHERLLADAGRRRLRVRPPAAPGHQPLDDRRDALLQGGVDRGAAALEGTHDLGGEVVGGRAEAAGGDQEFDPGAREERQGSPQVVRPVAHDDDVAHVHAQCPQLLGQPGTVPVRDPPGEHLGPGDDDAGARDHVADPRRGRGAQQCLGRCLPPGRLAGGSEARGYGGARNGPAADHR
jgi:hypothetical protein